MTDDTPRYRVQYKPLPDDVWRNIPGLREPVAWLTARAIADQVKDDVSAIRIQRLLRTGAAKEYGAGFQTVWLKESENDNETLPKYPPPIL